MGRGNCIKLVFPCDRNHQLWFRSQIRQNFKKCVYCYGTAIYVVIGLFRLGLAL